MGVAARAGGGVVTLTWTMILAGYGLAALLAWRAGARRGLKR